MKRSLKIAILAVSIALGLAGWTGLNVLLYSAAPPAAPNEKGGQTVEPKVKKTFTPAAPEKASPKADVATFAAGCFWGVESKFGQVPGVLSTAVGYSGGMAKNPTYQEVCTDTTGHAESVQVTFDPSQISYEDLVRKFFGFHDPTQLNRQGPDVGTQYRSVIFTHSDEQKRTAEKVCDELLRDKVFKKRIVTEIRPASEFYKAEEYHQKYYQKNKRGVCAF